MTRHRQAQWHTRADPCPGADRRRRAGRPRDRHRARPPRRSVDADRAPPLDVDLPAGHRRQHALDGDLPGLGPRRGGPKRRLERHPADGDRRAASTIPHLPRARSGSRTRPRARPSARRPPRSARRTISSRCSSSTTGRSAATRRFSTELVEFEQDADGVRATIRDRSTGELIDVLCDFLVGADGHRSPVRSTLGIPMEGPDDLGQYFSILFRADLSEVLGERRYGLYTLAGDGPPTVLVPSGTDDRFVFAIPLPPGMDEAAVAARFPLDRCEALDSRRLAAGPISTSRSWRRARSRSRPRSPSRWSDGRAFLVGDAAHRMTPRGGRGMNTAIADAFDLSWKLAWVQRGIADPSLLDTYEAERGPIGRRNVAMSMVPGGGGSDDGLAEDLGWVAGSSELAFPPDGRPGSRARRTRGSRVDGRRRSTLDLFGRGLVLLTAGSGEAWQTAARGVTEASVGIAVARPELRSADRPGSLVRRGLRPRARRSRPRPAGRRRRMASAVHAGRSRRGPLGRGRHHRRPPLGGGFQRPPRHDWKGGCVMQQFDYPAVCRDVECTRLPGLGLEPAG